MVGRRSLTPFIEPLTHYSIRIPQTVGKTLVGTCLYTSLGLLSGCSSQTVIPVEKEIAIEHKLEPLADEYESEQEAQTSEVVYPDVLPSALQENEQNVTERFIVARLLCKTSYDADFEYPCPNIQVALKNSLGHTILKARSNDGEFIFLPSDNQKYHLDILSRGYEDVREMPDVKNGEELILHLTEKPKAFARGRQAR